MNKYAKHLLAVLVMVALMCTMMVMPAFAEEPDANAGTYAAQIGGTGYPTFDEALTAAAGMTGDVTIEIYDKVTLNKSLSGSYDSIKFVGKDTDAEIYLDVQGYITSTDKKVAFEGLILSKSAGGFITNAGFMNVAFGVYDVTEVTYTKCTFSNGAYASSGKVTFTGCTFKRSHDQYGLWAYGNVDATVDDCTFADYRGIKMYAEGKAKTTSLTVKNSDFSAVNNKPAIVLTYGKSLTLEGNTYSSTGVFELDLDGAPNGTPVTSDVAPTCKNDNGACGVMVDGKIYTTVAQAAQAASSGSTVTLLHDSTETVNLPEGVSLDKNGHTADGVAATNPAASVNGNFYASLEAAIAAANGNTITLLKDITVGETINIEKDTVIDGGNHSVTFTCHTGFYPSAVNFTLQNITLRNNGMPRQAETHPQYVDTRAAANIVFDNVTAETGDQYAVNMRGASSGANLTIKNSNIGAGISGSNTINVWGNNHDIKIINSSLTGRAMGGWDFGVIAFNTNNSLTSNGNTLTVDGSSSLTCTADSGQDGICFPIIIPADNAGGFEFNISSSAIINTMVGYEDILVYQGVAAVGNMYYNNAADAFTAAKAGDTITMLTEEEIDPADYLAAGLCFKVNGKEYVVGTHKMEACSSETAHWTECFTCGEKTTGVNHSYTEEVVHDTLLKSAATCTSPAVYYKTCTCSAPSSTDTFTHGTALGHSMIHNEKVAATCTEDGTLEHYYCTTCKKNFSDEDGTKELATIVEPALDHDKVLVNEVKATCTVDGTMEHYDCSRCDAVFFTAEGQEQTTADKLVIKASHAWTPTFDATSHFEYCTACEATQNKEDHSFYEEWVPASDYHCHMCEICGYETDKTEHGKFIEKQDLAYLVSANDCVEFYFKQCEVCGKAGSEDDLFTVAKTDATHVWDEGTVTTPATCTTKGVKTFSCTTKGCTATHTEEIAVIAHTEEVVTGKAATCTETGLTDGKKCSVCGTVTIEQETIEKTAHTMKTVAAVEATYFAPGNIEHSACSVCSKLFDAEGKELTAADVVIAQLIQVEDNKADVSTEVVDNAIMESETTGKVDIVINVTKDEMADEETTPDGGNEEPAPAPVVTKTELPVESLEKVSNISSEATLTVNMTTATVTMDNKTLEVIAEEAKTSGTSAITLEIEHIETKELNEKQQEAVEDLEVTVTISASILNNGEEIHDFKGGSVTVAIPFTPAEGTKGSDYTVYYVADNGKVTKVPTKYSGGALVFSIGHFSEYIVVNTNVVTEDLPTNGTPATGDSTDVMLMGIVMILSFAMTAALITGKKNFTV